MYTELEEEKTREGRRMCIGLMNQRVFTVHICLYWVTGERVGSMAEMPNVVGLFQRVRRKEEDMIQAGS